MSDLSPLSCQSENLRKALLWVADTLRDHPEKERLTVLHEAPPPYHPPPLAREFLERVHF